MFMGHHHDHQDYQLHQSDNRNDLNGDVSLGLGSTSSQLVKIGVSGSTLFQVVTIIMMTQMIEIMIITMIVTVMSESKQLLSCVPMHSCARHCNNNNQDNENNEAGDDIDNDDNNYQDYENDDCTDDDIDTNNDDILVQAQNRRRPSRGLLVRMAL